jgi:carboxypeptidase Taq
VHETGHALYELGINPDYSETPLAGGVSLGIHESQSRFWENQVGKSRAFLTYLEPVLSTLFTNKFTGVSPEEFIRYMNYVRPGYIRTEADEVTYNLHIILRFELENALINKKIKVKDLPELWKTKMKSYLGVSSSHDSEGVLQDVHWSNGMVGYFPTYTLGNLYSAQFIDSMQKELKIDSLLAIGSLTPIREWLRTNIHTHGSTLYPKELVKKVTGHELNPEYFLTYIENKFTSIYSL